MRRSVAVPAVVSLLVMVILVAVPAPAMAAELRTVVRDNLVLLYERVPRPTTPVTGTGPTVSDFDGDGVDDLASTGNPLRRDPLAIYTTDAVIVTYSSLPAVDYLFAVTEIDSGGNALGDAVTAGDFNGDGYDDLVAAAAFEYIPGTTTASGGVWIAPGSADGLRFDAIQHITQNSPGVPGASEAGDWFGLAVAAGDLNGDGRDDLAIGAPGESVGSDRDAGSVTVVFGSPSGLATDGAVGLHQDLAAIPGAAEASDQFGGAVAIGPVNSDRYADLVIGSPGERTEPYGDSFGSGVVNLVWGAASGLPLTGVTSVTGESASGAAPSSDTNLWDFGARVAVTDTNGDGLGDVVVGSPGSQVGDHPTAGAVTTLAGRAGGLSTTGLRVISQQTSGVPGGPETNDWFGHVISVGDVNGDGRGDVLVGTPMEDIGSAVDAGSAVLLFGSASGLTGSGAQSFNQGAGGVPGSSESGDSFGFAVSLLSLNGTGGTDAVISAPWESVSAHTSGGSVVRLHAGSGRLAAVASITGPSMDTENVTVSTYGFALGLGHAG